MLQLRIQLKNLEQVAIIKPGAAKKEKKKILMGVNLKSRKSEKGTQLPLASAVMFKSYPMIPDGQ